MKTLILEPGRVRSLASYLDYFFLRFPGTLGPEEAWSLEAYDTYDRRWSRQNRIWVKRGDAMRLVTLPDLMGGDGDPGAFGLQKPVLRGRFTARVRALGFQAGSGETVQGQVVRIAGRTFLVLQLVPGPWWESLTTALVTEGLVPVDGAPSLDTLLKDRGPGFPGPTEWPPSGPADPGSRYLVDRLADGWRLARQYEAGIADDVDTECLHQYRVHLRRVRSLAALGRLWEVVPEWRRLKVVLRQLQRRTNELRDLDVLLLDLPDLRKRLPWDEGERLAGWEASLVRRRKEEHRQVRAWFVSAEYRSLSDEVVRLLDDLRALGEPWTLGELAASAFSRAVRGLRKSLDLVGPGAPDATLHEVRIQTKGIRYLMEGLGSFAPAGPAKTVLTFLKGTQESLGRFQDRSVLLDRLQAEREAFRTGMVSGDLLSFGVLVGLLTSEQGLQRVQALEAAQTLGSKPFLKALGRLARGITDGT